MQQHASESYSAFRFSRLVPRDDVHQLPDRDLAALAAVMVKGSGRTSDVPAGYTYLGQFIAHDLTFMRLAQDGPEQLRSPTLDLDSLYGVGPPARFYEDDGLHLRAGSTVAAGRNPARAGFDLPRGDGRSRREAAIPDPRNDENLAVAQTHLAFIRFHNAVADRVGDFAAARELVTLHYQWLIRCDYLPRVCSSRVLDEVFDEGRRAFEVDAAPDDMPTMPLEFAVAAFRFGHSMIRRNYRWNAVFRDGAATLGRLMALSAGGGDLTGRERLPSTAIADFRRLFDLGAPDGEVNFAMRIDTALSRPLADLPDSAFEGRPPPRDDPRRNLAFRDLEQGKRQGLATGQRMAEFLGDCGVRLSPLTRDEILVGDPGARLDLLGGEQRQRIAAGTPLWFYILREAERGGGVLTDVGARIVAETFHRAMEGSRASIVRDPDWRPSLGAEPGRFGMADLLVFAFGGREALPAPVG